ncbi:hypothetical protein ACHAPT_013184 [Fusarium lateritium]
MSNFEIASGQKPADEDHERITVLHVDWEADADFFTEQSLRPTTPLGIAAVDHQTVLARGAALHIRNCIRNLSYEDAFDASSLTDYRKQLHRWMQNYTSSKASQMLLEDVSMISAIEILSSLSKLGVEGELLSTIGPNLIDILQGKMDPLPLLLEKDRLGQVQENIATGQKLRAHVRQYLSSYAIKRPQMNVLEIGASTTHLTGEILKVFQGRNLQSYDLSDVSLSHLRRLKSTFEKNDAVSFKALDINQDPLVQGFSSSSYDVVIVNNALRIGNSLDEVLKNARKLLIPGGALVMVGMTDISPAYGLIFGMMEGMWSTQRCDQLPLPSSDEWRSVLLANSFSGPEPATKSFDRIGQSCYCVVSTALASPTRRKLPVNIITNTEGKLLDFAVQFGSILATNGMASSISDPATAPNTQNSLYVVLDEGTDPLLANPSRLLAIKGLASNAKFVFWVSMRADGKNSTSEADTHALTDFARAARKENDSLRLVSLVVKQDFPTNLEILRITLRIMEISFYQDRGSCELEYEYSHSKVLVPRVTVAANYRRSMKRNAGEVMTRVAGSLTPKRPLSMNIETLLYV